MESIRTPPKSPSISSQGYMDLGFRDSPQHLGIISSRQQSELEDLRGETARLQEELMVVCAELKELRDPNKESSDGHWALNRLKVAESELIDAEACVQALAQQTVKVTLDAEHFQSMLKREQAVAENCESAVVTLKSDHEREILKLKNELKEKERDAEAKLKATEAECSRKSAENVNRERNKYTSLIDSTKTIRENFSSLESDHQREMKTVREEMRTIEQKAKADLKTLQSEFRKNFLQFQSDIEASHREGRRRLEGNLRSRLQADHQTQLQGLQRHLEELQLQTKKQDTESQRLQVELVQEKNDLNLKQKSLEKQESELSIRQAELERREKVVREESAELALAQTSIKKKTQVLAQTLDEAEALRKSMRSKEAMLETQLKAQNQYDVDALVSQDYIEALEERCIRVEREAERRDALNVKLQKALRKESKICLEEMEEVSETSQATISQLQVELATQTSALTVAQQSLVALRAELQEANAHIRALSSENAALQTSQMHWTAPRRLPPPHPVHVVLPNVAHDQ